MNERIRKLAEQARKALATDAMSGGEFNMKAYEERFAVLIVRECANRIDYWESRQGEHSDDLLKHFGVEE